jgi:hypothetical protein
VKRPETDPLTQEQWTTLASGTPVIVIWCGGNGPHRYELVRDGHRSDCYLDGGRVHVGELSSLDTVWEDDDR